MGRSTASRAPSQLNSRIKIRPVILATAAAVLALSASACSSASSNTGNNSADQLSLTVAVPNPSIEFATVDLANAIGAFKQNHITIHTIDNAATNVLPLILSGKADIGLYPPAAAIVARSEGQNIQYIGNVANYDGAALVGSPKIHSLQQLQSTANCRLATNPPGTEGYYTVHLFIRTLGLRCGTVEMQSTQEIAPAISAGSVDAGQLPYVNAVALSQANQGNMLVDPATPAFKATYIPQQFSVFGEFGLGSNLKAKSAAVVAFLRGMDAATKYMSTHSASDVAERLRTTAAFKAFDTADLEQSIVGYQPYILTAPTYGLITPSQWGVALQQYALFGQPGLNVNASYASYGSMVDMGYYQTALR